MKLYELSKSVGCLEPRQLLKLMIMLRRGAKNILVRMLFSESLYEWSSLLNYCFKIFSSCVSRRTLHLFARTIWWPALFWPEPCSYWPPNHYLNKNEKHFSRWGSFHFVAKSTFWPVYILNISLFSTDMYLNQASRRVWKSSTRSIFVA